MDENPLTCGLTPEYLFFNISIGGNLSKVTPIENSMFNPNFQFTFSYEDNLGPGFNEFVAFGISYIRKGAILNNKENIKTKLNLDYLISHLTYHYTIINRGKTYKNPIKLIGGAYGGYLLGSNINEINSEELQATFDYGLLLGVKYEFLGEDIFIEYNVQYGIPTLNKSFPDSRNISHTICIGLLLIFPE